MGKLLIDQLCPEGYQSWHILRLKNNKDSIESSISHFLECKLCFKIIVNQYCLIKNHPNNLKTSEEVTKKLKKLKILNNSA